MTDEFAMLTAVGALWASGMTMMSLNRELARIRDSVLNGQSYGARIDPHHRYAVLRNDWKPTYLCLVCSTWAYAFLGLTMTAICLGQREWLHALAFAGLAAFWSICAKTWAKSGRRNLPVMEKVLHIPDAMPPMPGMVGKLLF